MVGIRRSNTCQVHINLLPLQAYVVHLTGVCFIPATPRSGAGSETRNLKLET
jgi:hypothetical protein